MILMSISAFLITEARPQAAALIDTTQWRHTRREKLWRQDHSLVRDVSIVLAHQCTPYKKRYQIAIESKKNKNASRTQQD